MIPGQEPRPHRHPRPKARIFLEGRYRKLVRGLPQTIFYCPECKGRGRRCTNCGGYGKLTKDSVQELIARKVLPRYKARYGKFHGAGREDLDVRMLGGGRPFIFEVVQPKRHDVDLEECREAILRYGRGRLEITELLPVPRKRVAILKETPSRKRYRALVAVEEEPKAERLEALRGTVHEIRQRTPLRVAHRRADKERLREVRILDLESAGTGPEGPRFEITIDCAHGTYVKEWISGEGGRSRPSFAELCGVPTRCLGLDVWEVLGPFPALENGRRMPAFPEPLDWGDWKAGHEDPWDLDAGDQARGAGGDREEDPPPEPPSL